MSKSYDRRKSFAVHDSILSEVKPHLLIDQYEGTVTQHDDSKRRRDEKRGREEGEKRKTTTVCLLYFVIRLYK